MSKYQQHYLSDKHSNKLCPLQTIIQCDSHCAWFDHEEQDCRMIGGFWKVREGLNDIIDELNTLNITIFDGLDALFQKS